MKEIVMPLVSDIKKTVTDTTPVFAAVGAADLAVEKVREARLRAAAARAELSVEKIQAEALRRATEATEQAQHVPVLALNRSLELAGKAAESYGVFAARGEKLVKRVRNQKATKDLVAQAETTVALGKGAVTTVRRAAIDIERSAKATLTTGRREAVAAAGTVGRTVVGEAAESTAAVASETTAAVKESTAKTRTAAKRTTTTTKKSAAASTTSTKRATTGARKTASASKKATTAAAKKVGD
jgi:hypothetical protein